MPLNSSIKSTNKRTKNSVNALPVNEIWFQITHLAQLAQWQEHLCLISDDLDHT
jgi:hypothetical protein